MTHIVEVIDLSCLIEMFSFKNLQTSPLINLLTIYFSNNLTYKKKILLKYVYQILILCNYV